MYREFRLYHQLLPGEAGLWGLKPWPICPLTQTQDDGLFEELDRREAFEPAEIFSDVDKQTQSIILRRCGYVWDPDYEVAGRGGWCMYWC